MTEQRSLSPSAVLGLLITAASLVAEAIDLSWAEVAFWIAGDCVQGKASCPDQT